MKKYYKFFIILLIVSFIIPQIALASWWNPFSWNIWNNIFGISHKPQTAITVSTNNPVILENTPTKTDTKQESKDQTPSPATTCSPNWKCETWSLCKNSLQTRACVDANSCGILTGKPSIAQSCTISCNPNWQCDNWGVCSNSIQTRTCVDSNDCGNNNGKPVLTQSCTMPQTAIIPTVKNYYYDSLSRASSLLAINRSFKAWLQDTSDQFRSAINTSMVIQGGGSFGELRDLSIGMANANVSALSALLSKTEQDISFWEELRNAINANPEEIVEQSTFNKIDSPEALEADFNSVKTSTNKDLRQVQSAITALSQWQ